MGWIERLTNKLRGARQLEWIMLFAAAAVCVLLFFRGETPVETASVSTDLEYRMEKVLSTVAGAGKVRVLVSEGGMPAGAFGSPQTLPVVTGVVIVAEGADDLRVSMELQRAARAFLGIDIQNIEVLKMEGGEKE